MKRAARVQSRFYLAKNLDKKYNSVPFLVGHIIKAHGPKGTESYVLELMMVVLTTCVSSLATMPPFTVPYHTNFDRGQQTKRQINSL